MPILPAKDLVFQESCIIQKKQFTRTLLQKGATCLICLHRYDSRIALYF